jgi:hypothetical protein
MGMEQMPYKQTLEERQMGHRRTLDVLEEVYQSLLQKAEPTGQPPEAAAVQLLVTATQSRRDDPLVRYSAC